MIITMDWDWFNRDGWPQLVIVIVITLLLVLLEVGVVLMAYGWRP